MGLEVADGAAKRVGGKKPAETRGVIAGKRIVQACCGIVFVAGETVVRRAGGSLQACRV
jgi:hypothetical protein